MNGGLMRCDGVRSASWGLDRRVRLDLHDLVGWPRSETPRSLLGARPRRGETRCKRARGRRARNHEHRRLFKGIRPRPVLFRATRRFSTARAACPLTVARRHNPAPPRRADGPAVNTILGAAALYPYSVPGTRLIAAITHACNSQRLGGS